MSHMRDSLFTLSAVALTLGLAACGGSQEPQANAPTTAQNTAQGPYGAAMGQPSSNATEPGTTTQQYPASSTSPGEGPTTSGTSAMSATSTPGFQGNAGGSTPADSPVNASAMSAMMDVSTFTDAQLAAIVQAINEGEIQQAQLALSKASSPQVKRFARDMLSEHRDMLNQDKSLMARLQITPSDNALSLQLKTDAQNDLSTLQDARGKDFDRDYVDAQVSGHNKALELVDRITPNVKSADMKASLKSARPKIEAHLRRAEQVQQSLQSGH
jgi:putative membrane protein